MHVIIRKQKFVRFIKLSRVFSDVLLWEAFWILRDQLYIPNNWGYGNAPNPNPFHIRTVTRKFCVVYFLADKCNIISRAVEEGHRSLITAKGIEELIQCVNYRRRAEWGIGWNGRMTLASLTQREELIFNIPS